MALNLTTSERFSRKKVVQESSSENAEEKVGSTGNGIYNRHSSGSDNVATDHITVTGTLFNCASMCCTTGIEKQQNLLEKRLRNIRVEELSSD